MGDDKEDKYDLTSLTELGEFLHELDPEVDALLEHGGGDGEEAPPETPQEFNEFKVPLPDSEEEGTSSDFSVDDSTEEDPFGEIEENTDSFESSEEDAFGSSDNFSSEDSFGSDDDNFSGEGFGEDDSFSSDDSFGDQEDSFSDNFSDDFNNNQNEEASFEENSEDSFEQAPVEEPTEEPETIEESEEEEGEFSLMEEDSETDELEVPAAPSAPIPPKQEEAAPEPPPPIMEPPKSAPKAPENFEDVKEFGEKMSYGLASGNGNPPYSIILQGLKYKEDAKEILSILKEHGIATAETEGEYLKGLESGQVLISQLSEYVAIILGVKFKRYDLDIKIGLSQEIHPTDAYSHNERGLVHKHNIHQNKHIEKDLSNSLIPPDEILSSTLPELEGHKVNRYISILVVNKSVSEKELENYQSTHPDRADMDVSNFIDDSYQFSRGLSSLYQDLIEELKLKASEMRGNAIIGIQFQLNPMASTEAKYHITCTGNLVWATEDQSNHEQRIS